MRIKGFISALLLITLSGCKSDPVLVHQIDDLKRQLANHRAAITVLQSQVTDGLTLALCSPELKQLMDDVNKECMLAATRGEVGSCTTKQIRPAVIGADPEHRGRFLKLMSHLPHEVLYMANQASAVAPYRMTRLEQLAKPALLDNTVFLVVSSPELGDTEAARRAKYVEDLLTSRAIPSRRIRRWVYDFPANPKDIVRQSDLPGIAEAKELSRGVWVFRADC
jgi:hypothetical protein